MTPVPFPSHACKGWQALNKISFFGTFNIYQCILDSIAAGRTARTGRKT